MCQKLFFSVPTLIKTKVNNIFFPANYFNIIIVYLLTTVYTLLIYDYLLDMI